MCVSTDSRNINDKIFKIKVTLKPITYILMEKKTHNDMNL